MALIRTVMAQNKIVMGPAEDCPATPFSFSRKIGIPPGVHVCHRLIKFITIVMMA
jgi:hypothetical protein